MNEKILCEKCGTAMKPYHECSTCGMLCPKCGWGWVTTYTSPIDADPTIYTVCFCKPQKITTSMIKLYAKLAALNFPQAKVSLGNGNAKFSAKAKDLQKYLSEIHTAGLNFTITPDYPYTKSEELFAETSHTSK